MNGSLQPGRAGAVAIVGGGASGTLAAVQLLRLAPPGTEVHLVERSGRFGPGVAYSAVNDAHMLNVCAAQMVALPERPEAFLEWLRTERPETARDAFVPRHRFGAFLEHLLADAEREAAGQVALRRHPVQAESISPRSQDGGRRLRLASGAEIDADVVVLALGNSVPSCPAGIPEEVTESPLFVADPWEPGAVAAATADETVLLLGSGLTMVDVALELGRVGGPVMHAVSRSGLLPHAHSTHPIEPDVPAVADPHLPLEEMLLGVLLAASAANSMGDGWRPVVDSLRPVSNELWSGLDRADQEDFHRRFSRIWSVHRHRMAPQVGAAIGRLLAAGRLHVRAGSVVEAELDRAAVNVEILRRGARTPMRLRVNRIINCSGPVHNPGRIAQNLVRDLVGRGEVRPNPLGLGFDTAADGALLAGGGHRAVGLYTLGPLRSGSLLETTAVPEIGQQAADLAATIAAQLSGRSSPPGPRSASRSAAAAWPLPGPPG